MGHLNIDLLNQVLYLHCILRYPNEKEFLLRSARPFSIKKVEKEPTFDPACEKYHGQVPKVLPPLATKPQVSQIKV